MNAATLKRTLVPVLVAILLGDAASRVGASGFIGGGSGGGGVAGIVGAEIVHAAAVTLTSGAAGTITGYASTARNQGMAVSLANGSITAPSTGTYIASARVHFQDNADTILQETVLFAINGAGQAEGFSYTNNLTNHGTIPRATQTLSLAAGDVVTVKWLVYTNGGGTAALDSVNFSLDLFASSSASFAGGNLSSGLTWNDGGTYTPAAPMLRGPFDQPFVLQGRAGSGGQVVEIFHSKGVADNVTTPLFTVDAGFPDQGCGGTIEMNYYASDNTTGWTDAGRTAAFRVIRAHTGGVTAGIQDTTSVSDLPVGNAGATVLWSTTVSGSTATINLNINGGGLGFTTAGVQYRVTVLGANASATTIN